MWKYWTSSKLQALCSCDQGNKKGYNDMDDGKNFFDQPVTNDSGRYDSIQKITTGQSYDSATGCLLDYL